MVEDQDEHSKTTSFEDLYATALETPILQCKFQCHDGTPRMKAAGLYAMHHCAVTGQLALTSSIAPPTPIQRGYKVETLYFRCVLMYAQSNS